MIMRYISDLIWKIGNKLPSVPKLVPKHCSQKNGSRVSSRPPLGGLFVSAATTLGGRAASDRRRPYPEVIKLFPGREFCSEPPWLFAATGPSLGRPGGISVLRKNLGVRAPLVGHFFNAGSCVLAKPAQFLLKFCLFRRYLARQFRDD
jgi:hypothetical protein